MRCDAARRPGRGGGVDALTYRRGGSYQLAAARPRGPAYSGGLARAVAGAPVTRTVRSAKFRALPGV